MTNSDGPGSSAGRLSNDDRGRAVAELRKHFDEGRLGEAEFAERSRAAMTAVTPADLAPLFSDLPPHPDAAQEPPAYGTPAVGDAAPAAPPSERAAATPSATASWPDPAENPAQRPGRTGATVMALIPFVALALFFITGNLFGWGWNWLWFILIPVTGILVYGPGGRSRR